MWKACALSGLSVLAGIRGGCRRGPISLKLTRRGVSLAQWGPLGGRSGGGGWLDVVDVADVRGGRDVVDVVDVRGRA
jgi:hypothetical protein